MFVKDFLSQTTFLGRHSFAQRENSLREFFLIRLR